MALSKETEDWLAGLEKDGGLTTEAMASIRASMGGKADEYVKGSALRQADYSRSMGDIQKQKEAVATAEAALQKREVAVTKFQTDLGAWKADSQPIYEKALRDKEAAENKVHKALARLKTTAAQYGMDENELLKDLDTMETPHIPAQAAQPQIDTSKFITRESLAQTARDAALLEGIMGDLADEHRELFGTRLNRAELVREAIASGKTVEQQWADKFKVSDKRSELSNAAIEKRIADAVAAKDAELRSTLPNAMLPRDVDRNNPMTSHKIFSNAKVMSGGHEETPAPTGVSAAVAAFQAGKHFKR